MSSFLFICFYGVASFWSESHYLISLPSFLSLCAFGYAISFSSNVFLSLLGKILILQAWLTICIMVMPWSPRENNLFLCVSQYYSISPQAHLSQYTAYLFLNARLRHGTVRTMRKSKPGFQSYLYQLDKFLSLSGPVSLTGDYKISHIIYCPCWGTFMENKRGF